MTQEPADRELSQAERAKVMECADLFFILNGTVQENIVRLAFAAYRLGLSSRGAPPPREVDRKIPCNPDLRALHGFNRRASHSIGRYVCHCEGWVP